MLASSVMCNARRMFIFYWNKNEHKYQIKSLKGLNKEDKIIYEKRLN